MGDYADMLGRIPEHERDDVRELAEDVLFMRAKLAETRMGLANMQVVVPYDNGGGQVGTHANPAFVEYQRLFRSYTSALRELRAALSAHAPEEARLEPRVVTVAGNSKWKQRAANG